MMLNNCSKTLAIEINAPATSAASKPQYIYTSGLAAYLIITQPFFIFLARTVFNLVLSFKQSSNKLDLFRVLSLRNPFLP